MGVTEVRPYFMQIISHNSMNVYWIPTKLVTEICLNKPFQYAKFKPVGACVDVLWWILRSVRNEEKN